MLVGTLLVVNIGSGRTSSLAVEVEGNGEIRALDVTSGLKEGSPAVTVGGVNFGNGRGAENEGKGCFKGCGNEANEGNGVGLNEGSEDEVDDDAVEKVGNGFMLDLRSPYKHSNSTSLHHLYNTEYRYIIIMKIYCHCIIPIELQYCSQFIVVTFENGDSSSFDRY